MATVACCQWPEDCAAMISLQSVNCLGDETDRAERVQGPGSARIYGSWTLIPDSLEHKARCTSTSPKIWLRHYTDGVIIIRVYGSVIVVWKGSYSHSIFFIINYIIT